jgi:hypothetical protein
VVSDEVVEPDEVVELVPVVVDVLVVGEIEDIQPP